MVGQGAEQAAPRSAVYVVAVAGAVGLLTWLVVAGTLNGLLASRLEAAGPAASSIVNLLGLVLSAGLGGATADAIEMGSKPARARVAGALVALAGWLVPFFWMIGAGAIDARSVGIWLVILAVMLVAGAGGADLGHRAHRRAMGLSSP